MNAPSDPNAPFDPVQKDKLQELTSQSWNLELVISGAALYAVLQIPDGLDVAFSYLRYNLMSQTTGMQGTLSTLAYSVLKSTCYVLFVAFLVNFVMRALWVGLVGLLAVYPSGIHYDRIPFSTDYAQKRMASELGSLQDYILRLDRRCNIVFAIAFVFVFFLILCAFMYFSLLLGHGFIRPLIPVQYWQGVKFVVVTLMVVFLLASVLVSLPRVKAHPYGVKLHYGLLSFSKLLLLGLYRPYSFITNTFFSHMPTQKILRVMGLMAGAFFLLIMVEFVMDMSRLDRRVLSINRRHLYTTRDDSRYINPSAYDNQRGESDYIDEASIQADVIREPFIRLYLAYPKALDTLLVRLAPAPVRPDTLSKTERNRQFADWSSRQVNRLVCLELNDSLYRNPELLFTQRGPLQQRGWQTVLVPTNLKRGKNVLRISLWLDSSAQKEEIVTIPFWYVPEN